MKNDFNNEDFATNFQIIDEEKNKNTIILTEKNKNKKAEKIAIKIGFVAVCFASIGLGLGMGLNISKGLVLKYEQNQFKFNVASNLEEDTNLLLTSSNNIVSILKEISGSVVNISTTSTSRDFFNQIYKNSGSGSGIIYKIEGDKIYIATNNHVVENSETVTVSITGSEQIPANLIGKDPSSDLAVISINKKHLEELNIKDIKVAKFGDSNNIEVGEYVFPIGNALGKGKTVTQGIISAQNKEINIDGKKLTVLQTDAAINPGNSGGALVNTDGEVIGINTAKLSDSAIEGIAYAIPSNVAVKVLDEIIENGSIEKPFLGIMGFTLTEDLKVLYNLTTDGVFVTNVEENSNAERAGLRATDIITSFNGNTVTKIEDISNILSTLKIGDTITLEVIRSGVNKVSLTTVLEGITVNF